MLNRIGDFMLWEEKIVLVDVWHDFRVEGKSADWRKKCPNLLSFLLFVPIRPQIFIGELKEWQIKRACLHIDFIEYSIFLTIFQGKARVEIKFVDKKDTLSFSDHKFLEKLKEFCLRFLKNSGLQLQLKLDCIWVLERDQILRCINVVA